MEESEHLITFRHEFETGIGYEGTILKGTNISWFDRFFDRDVYYEKVLISICDFENDSVIGTGETRWVRQSRIARIRMAHSLKREEEKAWELCKRHREKEIPFTSAIEDDLLRGI